MAWRRHAQPAAGLHLDQLDACVASKPREADGSVGPMGRSVDDLELLSRVVIDAEAGGRYRTDGTVPLPWRKAELPKRLRIGYWLHDGLVRTSPACQRAVIAAGRALESHGHSVVAIDPPDVVRAMEIFVALTSSDGCVGRR